MDRQEPSADRLSPEAVERWLGSAHDAQEVLRVDRQKPARLTRDVGPIRLKISPRVIRPSRLPVSEGSPLVSANH